MKLEHFDSVIKWWNNRTEIVLEGTPKAKKFTIDEIVTLNYNFDQCGYPHKEDEILEPQVLINEFKEKRATYNAEMEKILNKILELLNEDN